jgi:peroxiredoxin
MQIKPLFYAGLAAAMLITVACERRDLPTIAQASPQPRQSAGSAVSSLPVLRPAPAWTLTDVDGREVRSDDFKGKVVLVDFWATWCAPCRKEMPEYAALHRKYADRGLVILGMSLDEVEPAEVKRVGESMQVGYPLIMANAEVAESFGDFKGLLPTAYLIDREGNIRHVKTGLTDMAAYEKLIVSLL